MELRVYYEDTDAGAIVYHTNYIKYCERARSELFFQNDIPLVDDGAFFVVKQINNAEFIKSATIGDLVDVKTKALKIRHTSLLMHQKIYLKDELIFQMELVVVNVKDGKPSKISPKVRSFLEKFMD